MQTLQDENIYIREFKNSDKEDVRRISCETAFLGIPHKQIFDDDEILADVLTLYFTDYEPKSCFVAVSKNKVIGYVIGSKDVKVMKRVLISKVLPKLLIKVLHKGVFFRKNTRRFLISISKSVMKGEFFNPDFSKQYPATLHININRNFRGKKIGGKLIEHYLNYLKEQGVQGIHFGTMSERAKKFFLKVGFSILFEGERSYLSYVTKQNIPYYILGRTL